MSIERSLQSGIASWSEYRRSTKQKSLLISSINFSRRSYVKYDFSQCHFDNCDLTLADFSGANLSRAKFSSCKFQATSFSGAKLSRAKIVGTTLIRCNFDGTDCPQIELQNSEIKESVFRQSNARDGDFSKTELLDCDFTESNLSGARFLGANINRTKFRKADVSLSNFAGATLKGSSFSNAKLDKSILDDCRADHCNFIEVAASNARAVGGGFVACDFKKSSLDGMSADRAKFRLCSFSQANLISGSFKRAVFDDCRLDYALVCKCDFSLSELSNCSVFGISIWGSNLESSRQKNMIVKGKSYSIVTNSLDYAFFLYQCTENANFRKYFESTSEKIVLILGSFNEDRMKVIDEVRNALIADGLIPVVFDFEMPETQDLTKVVLSLALIARFTIVDLSDPRSVPHEIATIAPAVAAPIASIIQAGQKPYAMFRDLVKRFPWVLEPQEYNDLRDVAALVRNKMLPQCEAYIAKTE